MRILLSGLACLFATCAWTSEGIADGEDRTISVDLGELHLEVTGIPSQVLLGEKVDIVCVMTLGLRSMEYALPRLKNLAPALDDESFECRDEAQESMSALLNRMTKPDALTALRVLLEDQEAPEMRNRLCQLWAAVDGREHVSSEADDKAFVPGLSLEVAARPRNPQDRLLPISIAPPKCYGNPILVDSGGMPKLESGSEMYQHLSLLTEVPPGEYLVRVRMFDQRYKCANASPWELATAWQPMRVVSHGAREFCGISQALPAGWTCASLVKRTNQEFGSYEREAAMHGWAYAGPLCLQNVLNGQSSVIQPAWSLTLVNLHSWRTPDEEEDGFRFQSRARLCRFPLDCELEDAPWMAYSDEHFMYIGARDNGTYYLDASGPDAESLTVALKRWCASDSFEMIRRERNSDDLAVCLKTRCAKDELMDWLYKTDASSRQFLLLNPCVRRAIVDDADDLAPALEQMIALDETGYDCVVFDVLAIGGEAYTKMYVRLMKDPRMLVRKGTLKLLVELFRNHEGLASNAALAEAIEAGSAKEDAEIAGLLFQMAAKHAKYRDACVSNLVELAERDPAGDWRSILYTRFSGEPAWERFLKNDGDIDLVAWWKAFGSKQAWPQVPWLRALAARVRNSADQALADKR